MVHEQLRYNRHKAFNEEYCQFRIRLEDIISPPQAPAQLDAADNNQELLATVRPDSIQQDSFFYMAQITSIRNTIRSNMEQGLTPAVDYTVLYRAVQIDAAIHEWRLLSPHDDSGDLVGLLYKQMLWIYLWRTIYPLKSTSWVPKHKIISSVNDGLALLESFPRKNPVQTLLLVPAFVIGCGAFDPTQRGPIRSFIYKIEGCTRLDTGVALEVLDQLWRYMDEKDERSWDWESIAYRIRIDSNER
jgi:hypothetical protein